MKKIIILLILILFSPLSIAKNANSKTFPRAQDDILMNSIISLNELNYKILEIQSESGYILFSNGENEYLLMVFENGANSSVVKIEKMKNSSPLLEVQNNIYLKIEENLENAFIRADE